MDPRRHRVCPQAPQITAIALNKKVKSLALKSVLSAKAASGEIIVVDDLARTPSRPRTSEAFLDAVERDGKTLVVTPEVNENRVSSAPATSPVSPPPPPSSSTSTTLLNAKKLVIDKEALAIIEEVFA